VKLNLRLTQPARITGSCGAAAIGRPNAHIELTSADFLEGVIGRPHERIVLPSVDPVEGATGSLSFEPRADSLGIQMVAAADPDHDRAESNAVASRFAFLFFHAGRPRSQTTHFIVQSARQCTEPTSFSIVTPSVPTGWSVVVSPQVVNLNPGGRADVAVTVRPPATAVPGAGVEIGVDVVQTEATATQTEATITQTGGAAIGQDDGNAVADTEQKTVVGSMQVLARVVGPSARAELSCPAEPRAGHALDISGRLLPAVQNATVLLEYTTSRVPWADHHAGATETRYVTTDSNGVFSDRFVPSNRGIWRVQAFWPGDAAHAPTESNRCLAVFRHRRWGDDAAEVQPPASARRAATVRGSAEPR